jgi:hypothetical protein
LSSKFGSLGTQAMSYADQCKKPLANSFSDRGWRN